MREIRHYREHALSWIWNIDTSHFANHTSSPGNQNTPENATWNLFSHENSCQQGTHKSQESANTYSVEGAIQQSCSKWIKTYQGRAIYNNFGILHTDKGNEQTNTTGNTVFQGWRDTVENSLSNLGKGQNNEYNTFNKYSCQSHLPGISHLAYNCKSKKGIEAHTRSQYKWIICQSGHNQGTNAGTNGSSCKYGTGIHTGCAKDIRVDGQNIGHGHKCGDTGDNLRADAGTMFL